MEVSLNANELLFPAPFSRIGLCLYSSFLRYSAKKHMFGFDDHVYHVEIMHFKLSYGTFPLQGAMLHISLFLGGGGSHWVQFLVLFSVPPRLRFQANRIVTKT